MKNQIITSTINYNDSGIASGVTIEVRGEKPITLDLKDLSTEMHAMATCHGLKQKLTDAAAMSRNPENGRAAEPRDKYLAILNVRNRVAVGEWNAVARGSGASSRGLLRRALEELYPEKDIDAFLEGKSVKEQNSLRNNPKVAAVIARLRGDSNSDDILTELEGV